MLDLIGGYIPTGLDRQVREEACQDIAVAVLAGDLTEANIGRVAKDYVKSVLKQFPTKYGPLSLDQPYGHEDRRLLKERI